MGVNYVGFGSPDGDCFGKSSTEKIGFFGTTPVAQQTSSTTVTASHTTTVTTTQLGSTCDDLITAVNAIKTVLDNLGLAA